MNTYEIERKLADKADKFEIHDLQNENSRLKSHVDDLEKKIQHAEGKIQNMYYVLDSFFDLIVEEPQFYKQQSEIYRLRQSLNW
jgi:predicted  nucleic acid-binding Zn-ribbon protein